MPSPSQIPDAGIVSGQGPLDLHNNDLLLTWSDTVQYCICFCEYWLQSIIGVNNTGHPPVLSSLLLSFYPRHPSEGASCSLSPSSQEVATYQLSPIPTPSPREGPFLPCSIQAMPVITEHVASTPSLPHQMSSFLICGIELWF